MKGYEEIANSPILWGIAFLAISLVLIQCFLIISRSVKTGKKMGISQERMKTAFKTGIISAIGPSVVIVIGMVSLLVIVGGPTALMRLSYIGNVAYELLAAQFAAESYGLGLMDKVLPPEVFCVTLWCMGIGCIGWILFTAFATDKMGRFTQKLSGKSSKVFGAVSMGAMLGAYGYLDAGYIIGMDISTVATIVGAVIMFCIMKLYKRTKKTWLNEWSLTFSMVGGVIVSYLLMK